VSALNDPRTWRGLSSLLIVIFIVALVSFEDLPPWGWAAVGAAWIAFIVERVLERRAR
jgi:hypothetical protein